MSKGSPRVTIRVSQRVLDQIRLEIAKQNDFSSRGAEDVTLFILRAIDERIAHRKRSRAKRKSRAAGREVIWPEEIVTLASPSRGSFI